ncbi:MAG: SprT-like domain-containing protein [Firmicutes bacterium]|nr:SprT-like domain-containing protein [Bacillota bacterium]
MDIRELEKLIKKVAEELIAIGIPVSRNIEKITINGRARKRLGACHRRKSMTGRYYYTIEISKYALNCEEKQLRSIIAHELLHTCTGCFNHGEKWKKMGELIENRLGYPISRTVDFSKLGLKEPAASETVKYVVICKGCGQKIERKRMCNLVKNIEKYRCGKCGDLLELQEKSTTSSR